MCSSLREVNDESEHFQVNTVKSIIHFIKEMFIHIWVC